jgi:hypothetical protein
MLVPSLVRGGASAACIEPPEARRLGLSGVEGFAIRTDRRCLNHIVVLIACDRRSDGVQAVPSRLVAFISASPLS